MVFMKKLRASGPIAAGEAERSPAVVRVEAPDPVLTAG
jgi:hypothetical protein